MKRRALLVLVSFSASVAGVAVFAPGRSAAADEDAVDCQRPASERAPDPRCGETLDGRGPPSTSAGRVAGRVVLFVPRLVSAVLFWPFVETGELVEAHHVPDWYQALLTSDDGRVGVRPVLNYATGFLPSGGLTLFYRRFPGEGSGIAGRFQTAGPAVLLGELSGSGPKWLGLSAHLLANRRDDRLFAGIGSSSNGDLVVMGHGNARFASDIFSAELRWSRPLPAHFVAALHSDLQRRDYRAYGQRGGDSVATLFRLASPACAADMALVNACVDPALVPGFERGLRIVHAGGGFAWNLRQKTRDASGVGAAFDTTFGQGIAGDPSRHVAVSGEALVALGFVDRLLLLRGRAAVVRTLGDAPIPFEELVSPSGNAGMRGFSDGRFRGQSGVVGTAEYRWYVTHRIDASLFTDLGTVAGPGFAGLGHANWFPSYGVGLRFYGTPAAYWVGSLDSGVQLAYAPDNGWRLILAVATF
jgi:hypothetical protein